MLSFLHQALGSKTSFNKRHISSLHSNSNTVGTAGYLKSWCRWREGSFRVFKLFWLITQRLLHQLWRRGTVCIPNQSYTSFKLFENIFFKVASLIHWYRLHSLARFCVMFRCGNVFSLLHLTLIAYQCNFTYKNQYTVYNTYSSYLCINIDFRTLWCYIATATCFV